MLGFENLIFPAFNLNRKRELIELTLLPYDMVHFELTHGCSSYRIENKVIRFR
jgi:hypothetical protein